MAPLDVSAPAFQEAKHSVFDGVALKCDVCREDIVGPRFECIHCPSTNLCASCEGKIDASGVHPADHVFRLHVDQPARE